MTNLSFALRDSATMLRRDVRHSLRNLKMTVSGLLNRTITLLLFGYFMGGELGADQDLGAYINYVAPAIIIMTVGSGCATTAGNLVMDMNEGIVNRFRTMAISRASVLTGLVIGSLIRMMISIALVIGVALLAGFRPTTNPLAWGTSLGLVVLFTVALTCMAVAFGL